MDEARPLEAVAPARRLRTLDALAYPGFRLLWASSFTLFLNRGMQLVAFGWLVRELTDNPAALGLVFFAQGVPVLLFSLPAGVLADRVDRRLLMGVSHALAATLAVTLTLLVWQDAMTVPLAFVLAFGMGTAVVVSQPARQALVPALVAPTDLMNAIVLNSIAMNATQVIGPAAAGALIAAAGVWPAFAVQAVLYLLGGLAIPAIPAPKRPAPAPGDGASRGLGEAFAFLRGNPALLALIVLLTIAGIFFIGTFQALAPVFARDVLGAGAGGYGILMGGMGFGMLVGSLTLASLGFVRPKGRWFIVSVITGGVVFALFGLSRWYWASVVILTAWGMGGGFFMNLNLTLLQSHTPDRLQGRVMAVHGLSFMGIAPLGALLGGGMASAIGAPATVVAGGVLVLAGGLWAVATQPQLWNMD